MVGGAEVKLRTRMVPGMVFCGQGWDIWVEASVSRMPRVRCFAGVPGGGIRGGLRHGALWVPHAQHPARAMVGGGAGCQIPSKSPPQRHFRSHLFAFSAFAPCSISVNF